MAGICGCNNEWEMRHNDPFIVTDFDEVYSIMLKGHMCLSSNVDSVLRELDDIMSPDRMVHEWDVPNAIVISADEFMVYHNQWSSAVAMSSTSNWPRLLCHFRRKRT